MARFNFDIATPPEYRPLTTARAGEWNRFFEPLVGLQPGDVVNQAVATFKQNLSDLDTDPEAVQLVIKPVVTNDGVIVVDALEATARWLQFDLTPAQSTKLLLCTYYDVQVWVTRA